MLFLIARQDVPELRSPLKEAMASLSGLELEKADYYLIFTRNNALQAAALFRFNGGDSRNLEFEVLPSDRAPDLSTEEVFQFLAGVFRSADLLQIGAVDACIPATWAPAVFDPPFQLHLTGMKRGPGPQILCTATKIIDELTLCDIWNEHAAADKDVEPFLASPSCPHVPIPERFFLGVDQLVGGDTSKVRDFLEKMIADDQEIGNGELSRMLSKPSH